MLVRICVALIFAAASAFGPAQGGYLDEDPEEVFAGVYKRLGITLPDKIARDPLVWIRLDELKREPCDQRSIADLALLLEKLGYRRQSAESQFNFVRHCGEPLLALHRSVDTFLKLSDYTKAVEVADEFIRRAPANHDAHYLRGVALEGVGDFKRALLDYADSIELFNADKRKLTDKVFLRMANSYAQLGQFCEAVTPIFAWIAIDRFNRDTSQMQKIIKDYEARGNCMVPKDAIKERFALHGHRVVTVKAEVNGVRGTFLLDTGATYLSLKSDFADRAKIAYADGGEITLSTANGLTKGKLSKAKKVLLGRLEAADVPVVVQKTDQKSYGSGIDGLLGMSFLSRFDMQLAGGYIEVRSRRQK